MRRSPPGCAGCSPTCATPSRTGPRWRPSAGASSAELADQPPHGVSAEEVRQGARPARVAGRRPLHLPRLPRVRPGARGRRRRGCAPCPAPAWASCATTSRSRGSFGRLPAEVRAKAREQEAARSSPRPTPAPRSTARPTSTTSGSRRSTTQGEVIGERRFLGLFTSARLHRVGARGSPMLREKIASGPGAVGLRPPTATPARTCSRCWRPTRATSCSRPTSTSSTTSPTEVLHLQERRQTRLFLRKDELRPVHVLPGLPPARPLHHGRAAEQIESILRDRVRRRQRRLHRRGSPSRRSRGCTSWSASARARQIPDVDEAELERQLVDATRTWDEDLARGRPQRVRRGGRRAPGRALRQGLPRGVQGGLQPPRRRGRPAPGRGAGATRTSIRLNLYQEPGSAADERRFKLYRSGRRCR